MINGIAGHQRRFVQLVRVAVSPSFYPSAIKLYAEQAVSVFVRRAGPKPARFSFVDARHKARGGVLEFRSWSHAGTIPPTTPNSSEFIGRAAIAHIESERAAA